MPRERALPCGGDVNRAPCIPHGMQFKRKSGTSIRTKKASPKGCSEKMRTEMTTPPRYSPVANISCLAVGQQATAVCGGDVNWAPCIPHGTQFKRKSGTSIRTKKASPKGCSCVWRRHPDLNWGVKVLQTFALPLGYGATNDLYSITNAVSFVKSLPNSFLQKIGGAADRGAACRAAQEIRVGCGRQTKGAAQGIREREGGSQAVRRSGAGPYRPRRRETPRPARAGPPRRSAATAPVRGCR